MTGGLLLGMGGVAAPVGAQTLPSCGPGESAVLFGPTGPTRTTGTIQTFVVPPDVTSLRLTAAGGVAAMPGVAPARC